MDESSLIKSKDTHLTSEEMEVSLSYDSLIQNKTVSKKEIINAICLNLEDIIKENIKYEERVEVDSFYISNIPNISLYEYIKHIVKNTNMNISTLINAIIYIDNFCERNKYVLSFNNIYLIVLSSCLISFKFNEDTPMNNKTFSKIGGINVEKLNKLEYLFYINIHLSLLIDESLYNYYYNFFGTYSIQGKSEENK